MKRNNIKEKIRKYFFIQPNAKLRVRQIEKELKLPLPSVIRYVNELEKEGILKRIKTGNVVFYSGDRASKNFLLEKKIYGLRSIFQSGLIDYLIQQYSNPALILFGSYSKGEDIETSDIDIYIETPSNKKLSIEKYEKALQRKIQLFVHKNIKEIKSKELANNIINGIVINGYLEVFT